jgi:group I intron endonuclease
MDTYKATNTGNGKFYIGSTKNFEKRKQGHLKSRVNYPFQNALRQDPGAFEWEVWSDEHEYPVLEQALLDMWFGKKQCYNLNPFASRPPSCEGKEVSTETKMRISNKMKGREINETTRSAVSKSNRTRVLSEETLEKKSKSASGEKNPFHGKKHTENQKSEWSRKRKGLTWWINVTTEETTMSSDQPGPEWRRGRKLG